MPLNIPLPGMPSETLRKGFDTGSSMFARIMAPIIQREQMANQKKIHEQELAERRKTHDEDLALRKQQFSRSGANMGIQRQLLEQQLLGLQHKNDPMYELNQFKALQNMITGNGQGSQQDNQQVLPTQEMGEGMGMFTPQGVKEQQESSPQGKSHGSGIDLEGMKNNPLLRGFFKHKFGYDPLAQAPQTQEQKDAAALNLFKEKDKIKNMNKGGDVPTNSVLTQNQQALQGIKTVIPMLDEIIKNPGNVYGPTDFSPSKKAAYNAKTSGMIDTLVAAQSLPKVQASIDLVEQQIRRGTNESTDAYINRLKDLRKDLVNRKSRASDVIKNRKIDTKEDEDFSTMSDEELRKIAGGA